MTALLEVRDLHVGYGRVRVLEGVSLDIPEGSLVALVGSNGAGKSTLLHALSGLLRPSAGSISFGAVDITGAAPAAIVAQGLLQVAQGRRLFRTQSVLANLELGLWGTRLTRDDAAARSELIFTLFPALRERQEMLAGLLPAGQQQLLALAQALMGEPRMLLLDEPTRGLASAVIGQLFDTLAKLRARGCTILLAEHRAERALQLADSAYVLQNGRIIGHGPADELRDSELIRQAYLGAGAQFAPDSRK